jgi:hypothetical protein
MFKRAVHIGAFFLFLLSSCVQVKEVEKEPAVLKVVPESLSGESWRPHEIKIMVVCDLDAEAELEEAPWASIIGSEVTGNGQTTITIGLELNDGDAPRTSFLTARCGKSSVTATFVQSGLGAGLGATNFDGKGGSLVFDELKYQTSVRRYADGTVDSRILYPLQEKFIIFKGLPQNAAPGGKANLTLFQNWFDGVPFQSENEMEIIKIADGKIWISDGDAVYVLKY